MNLPNPPVALAPGEARYRLLVESVADYAIYMLTPDGTVATWNRGAQRFKGYTEQEIIGQHFSRFYRPEDRQAGLPWKALEIADREGRFEQEGWRVRKDGSLMWADVVIDPIRDESGTLVGFAKITRDISERKAAQDALRQSEEQFRLLVQGITDYAIYMLDPSGIITNWNAGARRFKGYAEHEAVGQHFSIFYTEEDRLAGLPERALRTAEQQGRFENEGWRVRQDGTRFWASVIIDSIRDGDGRLLGFAKVTRDVTEKRVAQQALEEARAGLVQAQKLETLGQLSGGIAHDFNNLLAVVIGNLDLLRRRVPTDPKLHQLIENSRQAAERGTSLIQRLLAFARQQELTKQVVDLPDLVRSMGDLLQRSLGPTVQITTTFPVRIAPALVDKNQLELALLNLAVNARDAMPAGGALTISAREETVGADAAGLSSGQYVCLSVQDNGEGMDAETLARAVEPFFTTKGVGKGTGLGLSMVHGFAEQSGGRLVIKSLKGKGTTGEVWLPVAPVEEKVAAAPLQGFAQPVLAGPALRVLVVDDDPLVLMNTAAMLDDLGHEVLEASSGEQALRVLSRARKIDLLVTDQLMPRMLGTQLVEAIRAEWPDLPVILATGYSDLPAQGAAHYRKLTKPFTQHELAAAIVAVTAPAAGGRVLPFRKPLVAATTDVYPLS